VLGTGDSIRSRIDLPIRNINYQITKFPESPYHSAYGEPLSDVPGAPLLTS
jgi:hypothetical protein